MDIFLTDFCAPWGAKFGGIGNSAYLCIVNLRDLWLTETRETTTSETISGRIRDHLWGHQRLSLTISETINDGYFNVIRHLRFVRDHLRQHQRPSLTFYQLFKTLQKHEKRDHQVRHPARHQHPDGYRNDPRRYQLHVTPPSLPKGRSPKWKAPEIIPGRASGDPSQRIINYSF